MKKIIEISLEFLCHMEKQISFFPNFSQQILKFILKSENNSIFETFSKSTKTKIFIANSSFLRSLVIIFSFYNYLFYFLLFNYYLIIIFIIFIIFII